MDANLIRKDQKPSQIRQGTQGLERQSQAQFFGKIYPRPAKPRHKYGLGN